MATAAKGQSLDTDGDTIFDSTEDGGPCSTFMIRCNTASAFPVLLRIDGMHAADEFVPIPADGVAYPFKLGADLVRSVFAKGDGGTADDVDWWIAAKQV